MLDLQVFKLIFDVGSLSYIQIRFTAVRDNETSQ